MLTTLIGPQENIILESQEGKGTDISFKLYKDYALEKMKEKNQVNDTNQEIKGNE